MYVCLASRDGADCSAYDFFFPLAFLFLFLLYHEFDEILALEEQVVRGAPIKSFMCVNFLQIFLWKRIRGLKISS